MEKEIIVGQKKFIVKEMLAKDMDDIDFNDKKTAVKKQVMISTSISEDEYTNLTVKERLAIIKAINDVNGFADFQ